MTASGNIAGGTDYVFFISRLASLLLIISTIFWIWAIVNTVTKDYFDGGVYTFFSVILSSIYVLYLVYQRPGTLRSSSLCVETLLLIPSGSHLLVAVHYAIGASFTPHAWGELYCVTFSGLWFGFSIVYIVFVFKLMGKNRAALDDETVASAAVALEQLEDQSEKEAEDYIENEGGAVQESSAKPEGELI
uniref:MARVEL domain-containing protein n=1 Tax=Odontella aurita TaxID=265563 RepID=A0A7S4N268_9STRA|mmetsp:Transcript_43887/g.133672  ORF Transcript_43887/g.133672 Transcript_43887/m.133672 type:complete len:190 (+) Transcript_43887:261-830(+)